jgi:MFS transporter, DHA1 family, multidrug resistance protein
MKSARRLRPENIFTATLIAYAIVPISGFSTDIYLPSMPSMVSALHCSPHSIQITLPLFLICYGVTQLFSGILLDSYGRYKISLAGLFIFSVSSLIIAITSQIMVIYAMRMIQGICVGFIVVACRALFVDLYEGEKRKNYISLMTVIWSVGPIVAPFVGGYLETLFGWRSSFYALSIYSILLFIAQLIYCGETLEFPIKLTVQSVFKNYKTILSAKDFIAGILILGISYALIMLFSLSSAFIIKNKFGYSAVMVGYASLIAGVAWMCGGLVGKALINRDFFSKIKNASIIQAFLIILMVVTAFYFSNVWTFILFAFAIHTTAGFIFNNYFTYCLSRFPQLAGLAGGLTGGLAYTLTAVLSYGIIALLKPESQLWLGVGYFITSLLGIVVLWFSRGMYRANANAHERSTRDQYLVTEL